MRRILITLSALLLIITAGYAQKNIFEKMPPNQRDSILIETAKNAVLKYAPGYYRDDDHSRYQLSLSPANAR